MKGLYRFWWDCYRSGVLEGVFLAEPEDIERVIGKEVYFGEVLGKHSEVYGTVDEKDIELITDNQEVVKIFEDYNLEFGYNPIVYYDEME